MRKILVLLVFLFAALGAAAQQPLFETRKITQAPIKYLIYSHHHYDHAGGAKPFNEAGATPPRTTCARRSSSCST